MCDTKPNGPSVLLDKSNLPPAGSDWNTPIDYRSQYKRLWGVVRQRLPWDAAIEARMARPGRAIQRSENVYVTIEGSMKAAHECEGPSQP
jgi:hypothetical protein